MKQILPQAAQVLERLEAAGYEDLEILDDGEWTAIAAKRP